jgi:hypothetical protein
LKFRGEIQSVLQVAMARSILQQVIDVQFPAAHLSDLLTAADAGSGTGGDDGDLDDSGPGRQGAVKSVMR